jgi:hypothetical protein
MRNMGLGTIQQRLARIKGRLRLWLYDLRKAVARRTAQLRAYIDTPRGYALADVVTLISVAIIAFTLGKNSGMPDGGERVVHDTSARIERMTPQAATSINQQIGGKLVASRKGKRWHYLWCPGAETISEKNKRYFKTEAEAEKAGYTQASNCK